MRDRGLWLFASFRYLKKRYSRNLRVWGGRSEAIDFDIDADILWVAATREVPALLPKLQVMTSED